MELELSNGPGRVASSVTNRMAIDCSYSWFTKVSADFYRVSISFSYLQLIADASGVSFRAGRMGFHGMHSMEDCQPKFTCQIAICTKQQTLQNFLESNSSALKCQPIQSLGFQHTKCLPLIRLIAYLEKLKFDKRSNFPLPPISWISLTHCSCNPISVRRLTAVRLINKSFLR